MKTRSNPASTGEAGLFTDRMWLAVDPLAGWRMEGDDDPKDKDDDPRDDDPKDDDERKFSQQDLNAIAAKEKRDGRRAAEQAMADQLGVPLAEAIEILKNHREQEQQKKDELTRAQEEANAAKSEKETAEQKAAAAERKAALTLALARAGAADKTFDDALVILQTRLADKPDAEDDEVKEIVKALKKDIPSFFGASSGNGSGKGGPSGDPGGPPPGGQGKATSFDRGRERARARLGTDKTDKKE